MKLNEILLKAYRTGKPEYEYMVFYDVLIRAASEGYKIMPVTAYMDMTGLIRPAALVVVEEMGLTVEPFWNDKGIRLIPEDEPNRIKVIGFGSDI